MKMMYVKKTKNKELRFCSNIINGMLERNYSLDHIKLQKLLFIFSVHYYNKFGFYPFCVYFEKWKLGPVLRSVYKEYKIFGYNNNINNVLYNLSFEKGMFLKKPYESLNLCNTESDLLEFVLDSYGNLDRFYLVDLCLSMECWKNYEEKIISRSEILFYSNAELLNLDVFLPYEYLN